MFEVKNNVGNRLNNVEKSFGNVGKSLFHVENRQNNVEKSFGNVGK